LICGERPELLEKRLHVRDKWKGLDIGLCKNLYRRILLPGMQESVVVDHRYHILRTTILLAKSSLQPRQVDLGQALEKYWKLKNVAERITIILSQQPTSALDEYLGNMPLNYPELPESWNGSAEVPSNAQQSLTPYNVSSW
jgi:hypothetical protein